MNEPELKPCPFCGRKASLQRDIIDDRPINDSYRVMCSFCAIRTIFYYSNVDGEAEEDAIEAWNRRADRV